MRIFKLFLTKSRFTLVLGLVFVMVLFNSFSIAHKYYVSITQIEYVEDQESLQFTSRIFIDDLEDVFRKLFDKSIVLDEEKESDMVEFYIESYLMENLNIKIDNKEIKLNYLGKEYENDIIFCYLEIEGVKAINSIEISNKVLFNQFEDQKNIVRLKINNKNKTFVLTKENRVGVLNFEQKDN